MKYIQKGVAKMDIKENKKTKSTPAQIKAIKKYSDSHYKTITYKAKIDDYAQIKAYADSQNISISKLCKLCVDYCLSHDVLSLTAEAQQEQSQD